MENVRHTKVLNVLISEQTNGTTWGLGSGLGAGSLGLVDDDTVGQSGGNEGCAVAELGHATVVVHAEP